VPVSSVKSQEIVAGNQCVIGRTIPAVDLNVASDALCERLRAYKQGC